jgi:hypothetical protein
MKYFHDNDFKKLESAELAALPEKKENPETAKLNKSVKKVTMVSNFGTKKT